MLRIRVLAGAAVIGMGAMLSGCSSFSMPDWMNFSSSSAPPTQVLRLESVPAGADARTSQGQTCHTPCSLVVQSTSQSVTFALNGYVPQTVSVEARASAADRAFYDFRTPPPELAPNPVMVTLLAVPPPPKPVAKRKKTVLTRPKTKTAQQTPPPAEAKPFGDPPPPSTSFAPPTKSSGDVFPAPPANAAPTFAPPPAR